MKKNMYVQSISLCVTFIFTQFMFTQPMMSSLHEAAENGNRELVEQLLKGGASINAHNNYGETALHKAVANGCIRIVELLIDARADIEAADNKSSSTVLHYAASGNNQKVVEFLIKKGANKDARDEYKRTPLYRAIAKKNNKAIIVMLLTAGADKDAQDISGDTALHQAAYYNCKANLEILLRAGANAHIGRSSSGRPRTPLARAFDGCLDNSQIAFFGAPQKDFTETIHLLLFIDVGIDKATCSFSSSTQNLLKRHSFDTRAFETIFQQTKSLEREHYNKFISLLESFNMPTVIAQLVLAYHKCRDTSITLFKQAEYDVLRRKIAATIEV